MTAPHCTKEGCTVAETGKCLLYGEPDSCEFFSTDGSGAAEEVVEGVSQRPLEVTDAANPRRFLSGHELGTSEAARLMSGRYTHLIAILGCTDVGKTCLLSSLYLLASSKQLQGFTFAGSKTLRGFEERARRLRKWEQGTLPEKLAEHTTLADPRTPAFMHLALQGRDDQRRYELMLTDLPGEWSQQLIERSQTADRFSFLHRADGVILMIDAPLLMSDTTRHTESRRAQLLLTRLGETVKLDPELPLILFLSKSDLTDMARPPGIAAVEEHAESLGFTPTTIIGASFSQEPDRIPNGSGVEDALQVIVRAEHALPSKFKAHHRSGARSFVGFRHDVCIGEQ